MSCACHEILQRYRIDLTERTLSRPSNFKIDMDDILEVLFASWWGLLGSAAVILLFLWIFLYLLSLRTQYSFKGKHILVRAHHKLQDSVLYE